MPTTSPELEIQSTIRPYEVHSEADLTHALQRAKGDEARVFCLTDREVQSLYPLAFEAAGFESLRGIEATEGEKSFDRLGPSIQWLLESGFRRDARLVVVGGGVVQDIGCFIASVLFRGARWSFVPTTLLAQCDSCIGSKSSVNFGAYKNQLGTFYPPHQVVLCPDVLQTLPPDELRSGMGEIIKLHLIDGEDATQRLFDKLASGRAQDASLLQELALDSLRIKKGYIEVDEFDKGVRNLLNYGHTFGHAFESATHYAIPHGIAVTLGVVAATFFSSRLGMIDEADFEDLRTRLQPWYQPYERELARVEAAKILSAMKQDKKNEGGRITFILTRGPGHMEKMPLEIAQVEPLLSEYLASF